jgi:hypothetical protein
MITVEALLAWRKKHIWDFLDNMAKEKGSDYSGEGEVDTFRNLRLVEYTMEIPTEVGIQIRLHDKFMRTNILLKREWESGRGPSVKDESLSVTILDHINYLTYIQALRAERFNKGVLPE